ncbi:MAG: enoyl-CoA hydratase/isomerase family protein [Syntrophomonadaceae bacterium]|nr:enoyl-CoA hydratase/isomerase family protein [Syntrophomonadaceae bacterium]
MSYNNIIYEVAEGIAWITLNRPEKLNSLSPEMIKEWTEAVQTAANDNTIRAIVVTGAGRAFCTGLDLKSLGQVTLVNGEAGGEIIEVGLNLITALQECPQPVIAMVNGHCYTGGLELLFGFDLIVASQEAKFGDTHAKWGIRPNWGLSQRMPRVVGIMRAKELSFTCRTFSADEAKELGLVNRVVPGEKLKEETIALARQIMQNSAQAIAAFKDLYNQGMSMSLQEGLQYEFDTHYVIEDTNDRLFGFKKQD